MGSVAEQVGRFDVRDVLDAAAALGDYQSHGWIDQVDPATAVLVHVRDQLVPQSRQLELAHAIPGASVHTVDGDHFAAVRAPDAFVPELFAAVCRVGRSSPHRTHAATALASRRGARATRPQCCKCDVAPDVRRLAIAVPAPATGRSGWSSA
jgi:hypothetical protein